MCEKINMGCKKLDDNIEKQLVQEYIDGCSIEAIMKKYGFASKKSIYDKIKKHYPSSYKEIIQTGRRNRKKYSLNVEIINSNFIGYFIGLMITDGYIVNNKVGISLCDEDCIKFIAEATNNDYHQYHYDDNKKIIYRIIFSDSLLAKQLERFGITERKSHIIPYLKLLPEENQYIPYVIRGIIDGDGCIYKTTENTVGFYICTMSYEFAKWIKDTLENKMFMADINISQQKSGIWIVGSSLQTNIFKLIAIVYDRPYGMSRKYNTLRKMFRDYNKNNQQNFIWNDVD